MDPCHAKNIRNDSVLGDLFSDACGNVGAIFNCLVLCSITGYYYYYINNIDI